MVAYGHWHRLVKNIGGANPNFGGRQNVVQTDKCMGDSQIGGGARAATKSTPIHMGILWAGFIFLSSANKSGRCIHTVCGRGTHSLDAFVRRQTRSSISHY